MVEEEKVKQNQEPTRTEQQAIKKEDEEKISKVQARIKGVLTRNHMQPLLDKEHTMLMRCSRTLSDGKLYNIFLLKKTKVTSTKDTFYIITMRQADNINEIYDLEITLEMAKKIFGKKNSSKEELQRAVMFETN